MIASLDFCKCNITEGLSTTMNVPVGRVVIHKSGKKKWDDLKTSLLAICRIEF